MWDPRQRPTPGPGAWRATPPLHGYDPLEPLAAQWTTWVLRDGAEVQPPPPVVYDTPAYWAETAEVLAVSRALTPAQARIADDWNLGQGSVTPAGVWNLKARALLEGKGLDQAQSARVLAAYFPDASAALDAAASEAALSRLYGGIHLRSDNDEGLKLGRRVGRLILERLYGDRLAPPLASKPLPPLQGGADGQRKNDQVGWTAPVEHSDLSRYDAVCYNRGRSHQESP